MSKKPKKPKRPELAYCKVSAWSHPRTPWRVWYDAEENGQRIRRAKAFTNEDDAWVWAETKDNDIKSHGARFGDLPAEARRAYDAFRDAASELQEAGVTPPRFEDIVAEAITRMRAQSTTISVSAAVRAYLKAKEAEGSSARHRKDLRLRLTRFEEAFGPRAMASITTDEIERWLASLTHQVKSATKGKPADPAPLGARSKAHYRAKVHALFVYGAAGGRRWVTSNPVTDAVSFKVRKAAKVEIYTPTEIETIMTTALVHEPSLLPVLALETFAGLRTSEAIKVDLAQVNLKSDHLRVMSHKTGPRLAYLSPAARAWFAAQPRRSGLAWEKSERTFHWMMKKLFSKPELSKVPQIHNGARHSFASYRCAILRSPDAVADEMGNSSSVIRTHYRELVTPDQAKAYFSIRPKEKPAH